MSAGTPQEDVAGAVAKLQEEVRWWVRRSDRLEQRLEASRLAGDECREHYMSLEQRLARLEEAARPFVETWDFHAIGYVADFVDGKEIRALPATTVAELVKQQKALRRALAAAEPGERAGHD